MTVRAELVRIGARLLMKRGARQVDIPSERKRVRFIERLVPNPPAGFKTEQIDAGGIAADQVTPTGWQCNRHLLFLHGGGYVTGSPAAYRDFSWRMAMATRARLLAPEYRLAPEHPFPAALEDVVAAYRWLLIEGVDPAQLGILGDSAGGGLAFALLLRSRNDGLPDPAWIAALSPWTDLALTGASFRLNAKKDPMISAARAAEYAKYYLGGADPRTAYASPLYGNFLNPPPTLIQVGSDEILRDDAVRMAEKLRAAGGSVELEIWPRMPHVWHVFAPILPEARQAICRVGRFLDALAQDNAPPP